MTNYEKIKKACQIANPKLMELGFGCVVKDTIGQGFTITHRHKLPNEKPCWGAINWKHGTLVMDNEIKEILGHPPQLSDVLLAIRLKHGNSWMTHEIIETLRTTYAVKLFQLYDLTKPLKDQFPECLQFIADLL